MRSRSTLVVIALSRARSTSTGGHAELGREFRFRRELLAVDEQAELDRLAYPLHHLIRPARGGEGRDQRHGVPAIRHAARL
jgi:hypothetical protein